jgi:glycosyltransferase involved in cell wall biosynthesis
MRILYCNKYNFPFSGTEVYLFELMELMRAQGHETALFSMADKRGRPSPYDQFLAPPVDFKAEHGLFARLRLAAHALYSREARRRLGRMIEEFRPDVAHVRNIYHHLSPSILWELKKHGVPVVYHLNDFKLICPTYNLVSHGRACERCRGGRFWPVVSEGCYAGGRAQALVLAAEAYVHKWLRTYQTCVDRFLAPSQFVKVKLVENGWAADRIDVIPHFQKLPEDAPPEPGSKAPIVYFGRLSREKGVADLLWAMTQVRHVPLVIAGDGPQREQLENLADSLSLTNVSFAGHLTGDALEQLIASARFTILPSRAYETLGKSILESYAQGRPVIASSLGSRCEMVLPGQTGLLFPAGDIGQLKDCISFLYERPDLARVVGATGRELVRERHSPDTHYQAVMRLYEGMVESRKSSLPVRKEKARPQLRVAFIGGRGVISRYSGIEAYYEEAGRQLAERGHEITIYCRTHFTPPAKTHHGMRLVRLPTIRSKHLETLVHTFLSSVHASFSRAQIVHYHALGPALFSFLPRLAGKKTVVTVQGLDWQRKKWGRLASWVLRRGERAAVRFPNATMVVSRALQDYYRSRYGAETSYVPNGSHLRERSQPARLIEWGLEPGKYILFLGRFSPEKNCHLLIEAYERLDTDVKLVLAGGSSYSDSYVDQLRQHQSDRIHLLEWVTGEALEELLTNAMLFVLPSDLEGLSLALLDAMAAGLCVLTSDVRENCEVVEGSGFTFRRGDVDDLGRMLRVLLADREARETAGRCAQQRVRESYLWPHIATQIEDVYHRVLGWTAAVPKLPARAEAAGIEKEKEKEHVA